MVAKNVIFIVMFLIKNSESARILAIMPTPSYSHQIVFNPLWLTLNLRGHHITLFTTDPIKNSNLTNFRQVDWSFAYKLWHEKHNLSDIIKNFNTNLLKCLNQYVEMMNDIIVQELEHPEVLEIMENENERFDLVITEFLNPAMIGFSKRFNCPFIGMSSMDITNFAHEGLGNPTSSALFTDFLSPYDCEMNFFERIINTFHSLATKLYFRYYFYPKTDKIVRRYFGEDTPKLEEMQRNASMIFLNINPIIHNIRPLMANLLVIGGGTHLDKNASLPDDIQKFLDEAESGAIYFSLGTNVKSKDLSEKTKSAFLEVFSELPYKVLWKFEDTHISTTSKILVKQWLPQQQILKHPNIKLFITQGGLQSLEESIYHAIPVIAMPVFLDQLPNVRTATRKGLGVRLDYDKVEKDALKQAIKEIITNKKYKNKAIELSTLLKEQPISGLNQAVWWTEYVIKHKGAKFMRQPEVPLHQYLLLDVLAFSLLVLCIVIYLQHIFFKLLVAYIREKRKGKMIKLE